MKRSLPLSSRCFTALPLGWLAPLLLLSGCMSHEMVHKELAQCPQYFQDNIGEIKIEPLSLLSIIFKGYVHVDEPNCPVHLLALGNKDTLLEESFHSFELRTGKNRIEEWERFYYDFHSDGSTYKNYGGLASSAIILSVPFIDRMPVKGKVNFHATVSHLEDTAECFVFWMRNKHRDDPILMRKCKAVEKFVNGGYSTSWAKATLPEDILTTASGLIERQR